MKELPDLFHPEQGRGEIDRSNVVLDDITNNLLKVFEMSKKFVNEADPRIVSFAVAEVDRMISTSENYKRRLRDIQRQLNKEWEEGKEARKAEKIIRMKRVPRGWKTSDEA